MPIERIKDCFQTRLAHETGALLPYFTAGFPDYAATVEFIRCADALGAAVVEVGIPYSDSIADGPVIQESFNQALMHGHTLKATFDLVSGVRSAVSCGLVAMVSYSIVHRFGVSAFMDRAAAVGFDGVILPDVPVEESASMSAAAGSARLCHIGLVAPTTSSSRREAIALSSTGFVYQIAVAGLTGERASISATLPSEVAQLKRVSGLPVCVGFGISTADHVREVCSFADGAIVGSAFIRRINDELKKGSERSGMVNSVSEFFAELMTGVGGSAGGDYD
ncbi:MAG: tryptophan synthase subunit alpha [Planctomycetota bacterium]|jgi:tryptophan synthase alpha chain